MNYPYTINLVTNLAENSLFTYDRLEDKIIKSFSEVKGLDVEIPTNTNGIVRVAIYFKGIDDKLNRVFVAGTVSDSDVDKIGMATVVENYIKNKILEIIDCIEKAKISIGQDEVLRIRNTSAFSPIIMYLLKYLKGVQGL